MIDFSQMSDEDLQAIANDGGNSVPVTPDFSLMSDEGLQKLAGSDAQERMNAQSTNAQYSNSVAALTGYGANVINQVPGLHELGSAEAAAFGSGEGNTFGERYNNLEQAQQAMRGAGKELYPEATTIGDVGANLVLLGASPTPEMKGMSTLGKIGTGTATGAGYGALYGAGESNAFSPTDQAMQERLGNAGIGAATGAVLGGGSQAILGGGGALAKSFMPDADRAALAQKAMDEHNIPITVSQLTPADQGKFTKGLTSAAGEVPFNQAGAFAKQQRASYNGALAKTFGEDTSDNAGKIMPDDIAAAHTRIGKMFDAAFSGKQIPVSDEVLQRINQIINEAEDSSTSSDLVKRNANLLLSKIGDDGTISGDYLNNLRSRYGRASSLQNDAAPFIKQLRDSVISLADDPVAREQYKNLKIIEPIAAKSPDGYVQPSMLNNRLIASRYFPDYVQGGGGKLGDLARIGNTFLKDTVPNSGTAFRSKLNQLMYEAPLAMGTAAATGSLPAGAAGALAAIPLARGVTALNKSQGIVRGLVNKGLSQVVPAAEETSAAVSPELMSYEDMVKAGRILPNQPRPDFAATPEGQVAKIPNEQVGQYQFGEDEGMPFQSGELNDIRARTGQYQNMPISSPRGQSTFMNAVQDQGVPSTAVVRSQSAPAISPQDQYFSKLNADHAATEDQINKALANERPFFQNEYATGEKNAPTGKNPRAKKNSGKNVQSNE